MKKLQEKIEANLNIVDINDISSFFLKSGFLQNCTFSKKQLSILNFNSSYGKNICDLLEFNEKITINEISPKYNNIISSINKIFNIQTSLEEIYNQYIYYTKEKIPLNIFINWINILYLILNNFDDCFNFSKSRVFNNLTKNKIDIFDINSIFSNNLYNKQNINKLDSLYKNLEHLPAFLNKNPYSNLIVAIYLLSLENNIKICKEIPNLSVIINYLEIYNKLYFSNIYISILVYIEIIILINLHLYSHKNKKNYFEYNPSAKLNSIYKNLELNEINTISSFFSPQKKTNNQRKIVLSSNGINNLKLIDNEIPNFYLFDNEIAPYTYDPSIKILIFQNYLKLYSFHYLNKNKIKFTMNLTIENIHELIKKLKNINANNEENQNNIENISKSARGIEGTYAPNNNFAENLKNYIKVNKKSDKEIQVINNNRGSFDSSNAYKNIIFPKLNILFEIQTQAIDFSNIKIMNKNNLNLCFNNFNFEQLLIKLINSMDLSIIKKINTNYQDLITKSNICYFQESIFSFFPQEKNKDKDNNNKDKENDITDNSIMISPRTISKSQAIKNKNENINDNLSIDDFFDECIILYFLLDYYSHLDAKKLPNIIQIKLNSFKCNINQKTKNIQVYFNFSNIKEKKLFNFLKDSKGMLIFIQKYHKIIQSLKEYKLYQSTIRVSQTNFRSNQLNYYFTFITHKIIDYIEEIKFNKILVYETQLGNYNPNMKVYLKDIYIKKKAQALNLKSIIQSCPFHNKIKVLLEYVNDFIDQWDLIVFSDNEKDIKLLKTFDDNKLFFFITKDNELSDNTNKYLINLYGNKNNNIKKDKESSSKNNKNNNNEGKSGLYEYLNIIMYIRNSQEDFIKIITTMQLLSVNKNSTLDYKTNLICDRFFFENKILLDQKMKELQESISCIVDDFYFISKKSGSINNYKNNKENNKQSKETGNFSNEYYNYDCFIGDDFVGVLNNHQYDITPDYANNFNRLIYDYLSVLSSCLELIYFILKSKNIFILRFVYILRTTNDLYYSWEYKNANIFIKKIRDFTSLFTLNIKNSIPLFCFLSKKDKQTTGANGEDNFYDVFLRLFLNLNKVVDNKELNVEFFKKVHKNIFNDYYFSYKLVAFSYESFIFFNDFFINNNYLKISNGEKFEKCYIIPLEGYFNRENYIKILSLFNSKDKDNKLMVTGVDIFNFGIDSNYLYKNKSNILFGFSKVDYLINEYNNYIFNNIQYEFKQKKESLKKKFEEKITNKDNKKYINKYMKKIQEFTFGIFDEEKNDVEEDHKKVGKVVVYNSSINLFDETIKDYIKEKLIIRTQKNELNVFQVEEVKNLENKNIIKDINNKKDCIIF